MFSGRLPPFPAKNRTSVRAKHGQEKQFSQNTQVCNFCKQNGSPYQFRKSHQLKDAFGNVVCPILSSYICDICGATGIRAHTRTYCPVLRAVCKKPPKSFVSLKNTTHDSSGRVRKPGRLMYLLNKELQALELN